MEDFGTWSKDTSRKKCLAERLATLCRQVCVTIFDIKSGSRCAVMRTLAAAAQPGRPQRTMAYPSEPDCKTPATAGFG
jgi:hypothetical protein